MFNQGHKERELRITGDLPISPFEAASASLEDNNVRSTPLSASTEAPVCSAATAPVFSRSSELFRRGTGGLDNTEPSVPDLWQHPLLSIHGEDVLSNPLNWRSESRVDLLTITGQGSQISYKENQKDAEIQLAVNSLDRSPDIPSMMLLCITLDREDQATFEQQASISQPMAGKLFDHFDIHSGFLLDLVGRPNYWAAVSQVKSDPVKHQEVFELFCQHPRWHQKGRYDKQRNGATQGNKAPCSLYMTYSVATNTTFYMVVAPDDGIWFSFLDRIRLGDNKHDPTLLSPTELVSSPYLVHALVAGIAFEQATVYAADVRNRLMTQLKQVNDYSDSQDAANKLNIGARSPKITDIEARDSRVKLQGITIQLHQVSQMLNTGLGSISSSEKLSKKLLDAHTVFCQRTGRGRPGTSVSRTQGAFQYVLDAFCYQASWLEQYKTRKETAMSFVFNMVTQQDSSTNLSMSYRMSQDSSSMHAITIVTMVFLPGTFTATLFSSVAFRAADSGKAEVTNWLWPFIGVTMALTATVIATWYFRRNIGRWQRSIIAKYQRQQVESSMIEKDQDLV